jgi:hypothetical protein
MAGLGFDNFFPPTISSRTHGIIDYIHAGTNFVAGALLLKRSKGAAIGAFALGGGVLLNALMTDYEYGVFHKWDFKVHGILDYLVAATSASLPPLLDVDDTAAKSFFYAQGGGETVIAGLTDYNDNSGVENPWKSQRDWSSNRWAA